MAEVGWEPARCLGRHSERGSSGFNRGPAQGADFTSMRHVTRILVLLLTATVGSSAVADCATATPMTAQQMACCAAMDHECAREGRDESCCPTVSDSGDALLAPAPPQVQPAPNVVFGPTAWAAVTPHAAHDAAVTAFEQTLLEASGRPIYLLVSLLLI